MIVDLLIGLPGQRPGGLALSIVTAIGSGALAAAAGICYASLCVITPRLSLPVQGALACLRGVPLLLLVFALGQLTVLSLPVVGFVALFLYSLSHVGETLRAFLGAYPIALREQARLLGLSGPREWARFRIPWTLQRSLEALGTHWVSLLKDTGALTVLGIGELTTVAKILGEQRASGDWALVITIAALLYLISIIVLIRLLTVIRARFALEGASAI